MFIEKLENNNKFEIGGVYSYAFACDSDSYHTMQIVSISDTRKTATIRDYYGEDRTPEKTYRKKISINYDGAEKISAGNYSMAGSWYATDRNYNKRRCDFDIDFMLRTEEADDLARALADFPTESNSVYTVNIEFFGKCGINRDFPEISLAAAVNYLENNSDNITTVLGKGWTIGYTVRKNGEELTGGSTTSNNPAALLSCIEADSYNYGFEQEYINILMSCASEVLPADVLEAVQELADEIAEDNETLKRAAIEITSSDPDNDPEPTDPTPTPDDTTYSDFDNAFKSYNIISVSFGGVQNSAEALKVPKAPKRKELTEKEWKKQLEMKAAFEAAEKAAKLEEIHNKLRNAQIGDTIASADDNKAVERIVEINKEDSNGDPECYEFKTDLGNLYYGENFVEYDFGFEHIPATMVFYEECPDENQLTFDENQLTFDNAAYSTTETAENLADLTNVSPIDENAARRGLEAYSFSAYEPGSATAAYNAQVAEVFRAAEDAKSQVPEEFHGELDRLAARYAAKLADWTNRKNRTDASCPSWMITGPTNYNMRKHEKQMQRLDKIWSEYEQITALESRIKNFAHEIKLRPIKAGDSNAVEKLRAKVDELTALQEKMKQANAEARKNGVDAPYPAWALSNNRQNLKRYADRLAALEKAKANTTEQTEDSGEGFRIVRNSEIMRLQIVFDDKPDEETRTILKKHGFKWAPSQGAWQRQLNNNGEYALKKVMETINQ